MASAAVADGNDGEAAGDLHHVQAPGLDLRVVRTGACVRVVVQGELDSHNSRHLEVVGLGALDLEGVDRLVLDCAGVTLAGSSGLGAVLELARAAASQATRLQVEQPSHVVLRILDLAGLGAMVAGPSTPPPPGGLRQRRTG